MNPLDADKPGRSPGNRSLQRGIELLRAFRAGAAVLGNAELAERTGLPTATVTRLAQTLVATGLLLPEPTRRAWRLAPAVLSLAHAMRSGSDLLAVAAPLMRATAEAQRVNVGLAAPDRDEMVYLESIRYARRPSLRTVVSGQRVPMELTSLGRAWLASAPPQRRKALLAHFRQGRSRAAWKPLASAIEAARVDVATLGYCAASWQPEVVAVATPLGLPGNDAVLNVSLSTPDAPHLVVPDLARTLLALKQRIVAACQAGRDG